MLSEKVLARGRAGRKVQKGSESGRFGGRSGRHFYSSEPLLLFASAGPPAGAREALRRADPRGTRLPALEAAPLWYILVSIHH